MHLPFADILKKAKGRFAPPPKKSGPAPLPVPVDKPSSEKFAKTVLPNALRTMVTEQGGAPAGAPVTPPAPSAGPRMVSLGRTMGPTIRDLPPAVALALEPKVERVLSLPLNDVISQMPEGYLKPRASFDVSRRVLLKAAEVEKGMAAGRPTIALSALYQQMPEIFMHVVPANDPTLVPLPFDKLVTELSQLAVRPHQTQEEVVPQFETPFLQVTIEDTERFGTTMTPVKLAEMPPVRMEPATAQSIAAAEPEPTAQEKFVPSPIAMATLPTPTLKKPGEPVAKAKTSPASGESLAADESAIVPSAPLTAPPATRIPFSLGTAIAPKESAPASPQNLSGIGTGEPAFPRVPASSGPPVPSAAPPAPTRIPFKLAPSSTDAAVTPAPIIPAPELREQEELKLEPTEPRSEAPGTPMVTLPLRPILESLPPMQLRGDVSSVPAGAKISFRFALIAPQLASGKVAVSPKDFHAALPAAHRDLFLPEAIDAPVPLPLPDVLSNLPGDALQMRSDQVMESQAELFETPFSQKADEDAKRFLVQEPALAKEMLKAAVLTGEKAEAEEIKPEAPKFDAKEAIAQASALDGVISCGVSFTDGLSVGGNISPELHLEGLSALAPTLLQKLEKHMLETQLGALRGLTIHGEKTPVSFFVSGNICLTAVHDGAELTAESRRELNRITEELSRTYAQPETVHVDH